MIKAICTNCSNSFLFKENVVIDMKCSKCGSTIFKLVTNAPNQNFPWPKDDKPEPTLADETIETDQTPKILRAK